MKQKFDAAALFYKVVIEPNFNITTVNNGNGTYTHTIKAKGKEFMNFNEYQNNALKTANTEVLTTDQCLINLALGLNGEAGEVADVIKKWQFQGHTLDKTKIIKELGDIMWYVSLGAYACGITLEEIATTNIAKLAARYPNGFFETERSQNRKEGDI